MDYLFFYEGEGTFLDLLILDLPPHETYIRTAILVFFLIFGVIISRQVKIIKKSEKEQQLVTEIMKNMTEGVYLITMKDVEIVWANPKFESMFGYETGEMLGKHASIVNAPTDKDPMETAKEITAILEETGEWHGEVNNIKKDGTPFWCSAHVSVFNHPEFGEVMVAVHKDITERKKADEEILKQRNLFRTILDSTSDLVVLKDREGVYLSANSAFCEFLGMQDIEIIGKTDFDIFPHEEAETYHRDDSAVMETGRQQIKDEEVTGKEGTKWLQVAKTPVSNIGILCSVRDITERKKAERAIKESHDFLQSVINGVSEPIMVIDTNYNVTLMNETAQANNSDTAHTKCHEISHGTTTPCTGDGHPCPLKEVMESGEPITMVHEHNGKNGNPQYIEIVASPLFGEDGSVTAIIESNRDITERQLAEEKLLKYSKDLEESNQIKELFGDIMRHDLMNPLQITKMSLAMVQEEEGLPEQVYQFLNMIEDSNKNAIELVDNAATFSRVENMDQIELEMLDILPILDITLSNLRPFAAEKDMKLKLITIGNFMIMGNPMIEQAFVNLIGNAIKYCPDGTRIEIEIEDKDDSVVVAVKDWGEGIPEDYKDQLFTRFTRHEKKGVKGSGLGLAIAKRIVDLHHGEIRIDDNPEGGSVFKVSLPKGEDSK